MMNSPRIGLALIVPLISTSMALASEKQVEAFYVQEAIVVDGELDERAWASAEPATNFIAQQPRSGDPATEPTEVRILYDDRRIYIGAVCIDSAGSQGIVVNDLSRDFTEEQDDVFAVIFDTFNDNQNGFLFVTNPEGARFDAQVTNDGTSFNLNWDAIWYVRSKITENGWQTEIAIPFKTLRFLGQEESWGINFFRRIRRKNEEVYWTPVPRPFRIGRVSQAGSLIGISRVQQSRNLYVKPYVSGPITRLEGDDVDLKPDVGLDVKWGVSSQLTLDLTVNTEFSQVEADEEQVNLTRFSLFFPEKREFFLENAGFFEFGEGVGGFRQRFGPPDLVPFFSRRIGISEGRLVPILGGARLTGRTGAYTLGLLSMQTDDFEDDPSTNFSVFRVRRDVLQSSNLGVLLVNKEAGQHFNRTYGVDGNFNFLNSVNLTSYFLKTDTPGVSGQDGAGKIDIAWRDPFWRAQAEFLTIEENFNPEVGFVLRRGIRRSAGEFSVAFRPEGRLPWIREIRPSFEPQYTTDQQNKLLTRVIESQVIVEMEDGGQIFYSYDNTFERLDEVFDIREDQVIPVGDYRFNQSRFLYTSNQSVMFSGQVGFTTGEFFDGNLDSYDLGFQMQPNYRFRAGINWGHNDVTLPTGSFSTDVVGTRVQYSFSTNMFLNALIQYNSDDGEIFSNIRFNLIHKPLSDLFIVYNERRLSPGSALDRALIVKFTHLLSF